MFSSRISNRTKANLDITSRIHGAQDAQTKR
jgi:hypothetical protein